MTKFRESKGVNIWEITKSVASSTRVPRERLVSAFNVKAVTVKHGQCSLSFSLSWVAYFRQFGEMNTARDWRDRGSRGFLLISFHISWQFPILFVDVDELPKESKILIFIYLRYNACMRVQMYRVLRGSDIKGKYEKWIKTGSN